MKNLIKNLCFLFILLFGYGIESKAATTLSAGDVVILEFNGNGTDGFTFMPLVNLEAGTVIHFTDYGWNATSGAFNTVEEGNGSGGGNMITYTAPSAVTAGTLIRQDAGNTGGSAFIADADFSSYNYSSLNYIYALNSLSTGHDGIQVFQGSASSPTFIWGYHTGQWGQGSYANYYWSDLPTGLTNGTNAVYFADNSSWSDVTVDDGYYSGPTTSADASTWRTRVANSANWTTSATGTAPTLLYPNTYTVTASAATAPTATTGSASSVSSTAATLNGTVNANGASTTVTFNYGTSTSYGSIGTPTQSPVTGSTATAVSYALTGLTPNTTYHFRVVGVNSVGTTNGADSTFTTSAIAPTAATKSPSSISSTAATLNGTVNPNNATSVVTFEYGTSTSYGSSATATQSPVTGTSATSVSAALTGLTPNTIYHFRVKAINTAGTTYGADSTFTTSAIAPTVATKSPSSISSTAATLNGTVNPNNATSVVTFDYGTSTSYGSSATATQSPVIGTSATSVSAALTGLTPNTIYHFRVKAINTAGTTYGADSTFTTSKVAPVVTTQDVTNVSANKATGNGTITVLGSPAPISHGVCWNTTGNPTVADAKVDSGAVSSTGAFTAAITGLTANTTYYVRAYAISVTDTVYGGTVSFSTTATGISTAETEKVILYPNPVKDAFQIGGINDKAVITVLDIKGKTLFTKEVSANESILASALPQGVYIVRITTDVGTVEQKIVKK